MTNSKHWPGCATEGGPAHYECAVAEIKKQRDNVANVALGLEQANREIDWLREQETVLTHNAAVQEAEITRLRALLETQK